MSMAPIRVLLVDAVCERDKMAPIRVLLVDDSPLFLASAARVLAADPDLDIVGRVLSGQAALEQIAHTACDLVLVDLAMPDMNGLELAQRLRQLPQPPRIVLLSLDDTPEHRTAAAACTDGFVGKLSAATQLLPLIRSLFQRASVSA
jgi:DNA-binding NarL/FixJ family response regulator